MAPFPMDDVGEGLSQHAPPARAQDSLEVICGEISVRSPFVRVREDSDLAVLAGVHDLVHGATSDTFPRVTGSLGGMDGRSLSDLDATARETLRTAGSRSTTTAPMFG